MAPIEQPSCHDESLIVQLVPSQEAALFLDRRDLPDEDTLRQLRALAYSRDGSLTLGGPEIVQAIYTIAEYAEQGVIGGAAYALSASAVAYLKRLSAKRNPEKAFCDAESARQLASDFSLAVFARQNESDPKVVSINGERSAWRVHVLLGNRLIEVYISSVSVVSLRILSKNADSGPGNNAEI